MIRIVSEALNIIQNLLKNSWKMC